MRKALSVVGMSALGLLGLAVIFGRFAISLWILFSKMPASSGTEYAVWWVALLVCMFAGGSK